MKLMYPLFSSASTIFGIKSFSVDPVTSRPRLVHAFRRIFNIDFNSIILWLQLLKVFSYEYKDAVINDTLQSKVSLEENINKILQNARIADSEDVLDVHKMCGLNHPNAPSATDIAEPCFSDYATSTTHVSIDTYDTIPEDKSVNIAFGSIDHSFVESNVPIHESTNPLVLKPLLQSISNGLQDFVHEQLQSLKHPSTCTSTFTMDTSSSPSIRACTTDITSTIQQGVTSMDTTSPTTTPVKDCQLREIIRTPTSPIKVTSPGRQIGDMVIHLPVTHNDVLLNEYTESSKLYSCSSPHLFPFGATFLHGPLSDSDTQHLMNQAQNNYADDFEFNFQVFNQRARSSAAQGVRAKFKPGSTNMSRLQSVINQPEFLGRLYDGIDNPDSKDAKAVLHEILPLIHIAGQHIPFGEAGASNTALANMLYLHRFFSNYAFSYHSIL